MIQSHVLRFVCNSYWRTTKEVIDVSKKLQIKGELDEVTEEPCVCFFTLNFEPHILHV